MSLKESFKLITIEEGRLLEQKKEGFVFFHFSLFRVIVFYSLLSNVALKIVLLLDDFGGYYQ
jgi:hypothetical protein